MKKIAWIAIGGSAVAGFAAGVFLAIPERGSAEIARVHIGNTSVIAELAQDPESRQRGLGGRDSLADGHGMLFLFAQSDRYAIWMKSMRFPLDIFWINNGRVVDLEERVLSPDATTSDIAVPIYTPDVAARYVLETPAGFATTHQIHIGDPVAITVNGRALVAGEVLADSSGEGARLYGAADEAGADYGIQSPPAGFSYFIETLRDLSRAGRDFVIGSTVERGEGYTLRATQYRAASGKLISGFIYVPDASPPAGGFPLLLLQREDTTLAISGEDDGAREAARFFAANGYSAVVLESTARVAPYDFYVEATENTLDFLDALSAARPVLININRMGVWGGGAGGMIATRLAVLRPEIRAFVLVAPLSAAVQDHSAVFQKEAARSGRSYRESDAPASAYDKISPLAYFDAVAASIQLHHGVEDHEMPIAFSKKIFSALQIRRKKVEFFSYPGVGHIFDARARELAMERGLQFFDFYVKNAR